MILTCMLGSDDKGVRNRAIRKIKENRKKPPAAPKSKLFQGVRKFVVPNLVWKAKKWEDIIDWKNVKIFEPNLIEKKTLEEIEAAREAPLDLPPYSLHSQSVSKEKVAKMQMLKKWGLPRKNQIYKTALLL